MTVCCVELEVPTALTNILVSHHIIFLQETTETNFYLLKSICLHYNMTLIYKTKKSLTMIVINYQHITFQNSNTLKSIRQSYCFTDAVIKINGLKKSIHLVSVYYPITSETDNQLIVNNALRQLPRSHHIILGGDFNHILDPELDAVKTVSQLAPKQAVTHESESFYNDYNLVDVFRVRHPTTKSYTSRNTN